MKTLYLKKIRKLINEKSNVILIVCINLFFNLIIQISSVNAQAVLFDFDNAPLHSSLPVSLTVNGITAQFSATGQGYSIQESNTMGFTPKGFSGNCIYPNSVYLADLLVSFDKKLTDFSVMYSCQELGCDDAARMRVTAYMNGILVGTNTKIATNPGTWPVDTLGCNFPQGFNSVVIHYDSRPPTCQDYGVIYLADNMRVTTAISTGIINESIFNELLIIPNPISQFTKFSFSLSKPQKINITIYDITGKLIKNLVNGSLNQGEHQLTWNVNDDAIDNGMYFLKVTSENFSQSYKLIVTK